jgi:hypothetical protein
MVHHGVKSVPKKQVSKSREGITLRSVCIGVLAVVAINLWVTYAETVVRSSRLNLSFFSADAAEHLHRTCGRREPADQADPS